MTVRRLTIADESMATMPSMTSRLADSNAQPQLVAIAPMTTPLTEATPLPVDTGDIPTHDTVMPTTAEQRATAPVSDETDEAMRASNDLPGGFDSLSERPKWWPSWSTSHLAKLVKEAKGLASASVIEFAKKYWKGTKLIFVVGQAGTGKSSLLCELTGMDLRTGSTMKSATRTYHICPAYIKGQQYLFIDTAGFGAADLDNKSNFEDIIACLDALGPFTTAAGVLFVLGGDQPRLSVEDLRTIQWVKAFCGPAFFEAITMVTTRWDMCNEDGFEAKHDRVLELIREECIAQIMDPQADSYKGGVFYHHGLPGGRLATESFPVIMSKRKMPKERSWELRELIHRQHEKPPAGSPKLQVVREMEDGIPGHRTQAAIVLQSDPSTLELSIQDGMVRVVRPATPSMDEEGDKLKEQEGKIQEQVEEEVEMKTIPSNAAAVPPEQKLALVKRTAPPGTAPPGTAPPAWDSLDTGSCWRDRIWNWFSVIAQITSFFRSHG